MFSSENNHKNDLNLFYYKDHICLIKDLNKYLHRNNGLSGLSYLLTIQIFLSPQTQQKSYIRKQIKYSIT